MTSQTVRTVSSEDASPKSFMSPRAQVVRTSHLNEPIFFTVDNANDVIQLEHARGKFYELEELDLMSRRFPLGGSFLDIGANAGNHTLFMAKMMRAKRIVPIEPNPLAIELLNSNIHLNDIQGNCDLQYLGIALSDGTHENSFIRTGVNNLGGSRIKEGQGDIPLSTADSLLNGQHFDLIKIDVEGHELKVLSGMTAMLQESTALVFIEVDRKNDPEFHNWISSNNYRILDEFQRYRSNKNYLIAPK